jgi:poly[(R)-3-hydroxyalkanoate] polymerase subunit PhaC
MLFPNPRAMRRGKKLARLAADRALLRFVNGLALVMDGSMTPRGDTPRERLYQRGKLEVWRYLPPSEDAQEPDQDAATVTRRFPVPILLVPPLMVRPYIYDLRPDHSLVRFLRRAGFDVYLVDFGVPEAEDAHTRLDDYVLDFMPRAIETVRAAHGTAELSLVGWCMGAIFSLLHTAAWDDAKIRNIVSIAAPIDFAKMGLLTHLARAAHGQVQFLADRIGNVPGFLNSQALKLLAPVKRLTRYADLFVNLYDDEWVKGYDAMSHWSNDFIAYPQQAFKQFMQDVMVGNRLMQGMTFGERVADLKKVTCPVLAFAGRDDAIATPASARAIVDATRPREHEYHEVHGGHIGVVVGGRAPREVWTPMIEWLRPRSLSLET